MGEVKRTKDNPFHKSKYAELSGVLDATREPLAENGLSVIQFPTSKEGQVGVTTRILHESGEFMEDSIYITPKETNNPQVVGSIITYFRRYALQGVTNVAPEDDDDGNVASVGKEEKASETPKGEEKKATSLMTKGQKIFLDTLLTNYGLKTDADRLGYVKQVLGREPRKIDPLSELSIDNSDISSKEAHTLIGKLQKEVKPS